MKLCPECNSNAIGLYAEIYTKVWRCNDCGYSTQCYKDDEINDGDESDLIGDMQKELHAKDMCPDCGEARPTISSNMTGNVKRCIKCEDKKRKELGLPVTRPGIPYIDKVSTNFRPYWLEHGNLEAVEKEPEFDSENRKLYIKNRRHEDDMCRKMNCHFGEKGEEVLGHKLGYDKPKGNLKVIKRRDR